MKLEEAIEIGEIELATCTHQEDPKWVNAIGLLIEAGGREMECRKGLPPEAWDLLPGETPG